MLEKYYTMLHQKYQQKYQSPFLLVTIIFCTMVFSLSLRADVVSSQMDLLDDESLIEIGDILSYEVLEEKEPALRLRVQENGKVALPLLGEMPAVGQTPRALAIKVKKELEVDYFYRATVIIEKDVSLTVKEITVLGEVNRPGVVPYPAQGVIQLSDVILRTGGFTPSANQKKVEIIRPRADGEETRLLVDVSDIFENGDLSKDLDILANDLILVPRTLATANSVYVVGAVLQPGYLNLSNNQTLTVSKAILDAGGFTKFANRSKVKLIRTNSETNEKETFTINVNKILEDGERDRDMVVQANDIIRVEERWIVF